jgi:hypothetical protein
MPQSVSSVLVHLVFSTKDRRPFLNDSIRGEMHAYLASVLNSSDNDAQAAHHRRRDFQAEMRAMFVKYGVEFDERFVWD